MKQVVHTRRQTPQGKAVAKPDTLLLTILILACESVIEEDHGALSSPWFEKNDPWTETS